MDTGNQRPLEITRQQWATSENAAKHYEVVQEVLIRSGIAHVNVNCDPNKPYDEPIYIDKPERIISFDETRLAMDMTVRAWRADGRAGGMV